MSKQSESQLIKYNCHLSPLREGENYTSMHGIGIVISGEIELYDGLHRKRFMEGDIYSIRKDHLLKFIKFPPANNEFKSLTIHFDEELLRQFSREYDYKAQKKQNISAYALLPSDYKVLYTFMNSLTDYEDLLVSNKNLINLKQKEALMLLLDYDVSFQDVLFDFSIPHKIDLEAFMNKNFHFNVPLDKFAYLTGRSIATFKRDFQKVFNTSPRNWLQHKRLKEAHCQIAEKGKMPSDIYLDLGFENLSHFSFAFKKEFGYAPSDLFKSSFSHNKT